MKLGEAYQKIKMQCSTVVLPEAKSDGKFQGQGYWGISDLEGEKDFNNNHREEITDFVQLIPGFQECDEKYIETWMVCDAENCGFPILNDDGIVTSVINL
ncbi:UNVERIFIED_CONTAM: hypothetical protein NCL1_28191 [Trichonephila clavipes]